MTGTNWMGYTEISPISGTDSFYPNEIMPSSGADPQDWYYLFYSMPGSTARRIGEQRTCNPLWNVFGCREAVTEDQVTPVVPVSELPPQYQAEDDEIKAHSEAVMTGYDNLLAVTAPIVGVVIVGCLIMFAYDKWA
jgi:hypothetical protein